LTPILLMAPLLPEAHDPHQPNDKMRPMPQMHCFPPAPAATPCRTLHAACRWAAGFVLACTVLAGAIQPAAAATEAGTSKPLQLRIVGGLAGLTQYTQFEEPFWTQELPRLTQGQLRADIVPFNKAGLRTHEALRLIQLGVVPFGTVLLSGVLTTDPELAALDLAGLNPDMASLRRSMAAFRPHLEQTMRERHGIEVLAIYTYPPQITFCTKPFKGLSDLSGRRVRISNPTQADLLRPFGVIPLQVEFSELMANVRNGNVDCAITGGMTGNTIGLHTLTSHLHTSATTWGISVFGANKAAWNALPASARDTLRTALRSLEAAVWEDAEQQMRAGVACNTGQAGCLTGKPGQMTEVATSTADEQKLREAFRTSVLPAWLQRCGDTCAPVWNRLMAPATGLRATPLPRKP